MANVNAIAAAMIGTKGNSSSSLSPLVQSYQQSSNVNQPYRYLPRTEETFTIGSFGPGGPIQPMPINPPRDDESGRPDPRRGQFPINWNLPIGQPGTEGLKLASFATLRAAADEYSVARACINRRIHEIVPLEWDIIPTDAAELEMRNKKNKRADWDRRREEVRKFFRAPDSDKAKYPTFQSWLTALLEDVAVVDAAAVYMRPPRKKKSGPFGSDLASLDIIDGTTIRPMLDINGATPRAPEVAYQQYLWGVPRSDMTAVITDADIEILGKEPVKEYRADQLMYLRMNQRSWTPYGFSWVEQVIMPIAIGLARQQWQWNYYQEGSIPGQWVTAGPDISTPQQIRQFQDALNALAGDPAQKHKIIVLPPGSASKDMKPITLADAFDEWVVSTVTMGFGLTPEDIGIAPKVALNTGTQGAKQAASAASDIGAQNRIEPVTDWLKDVLFDYVIQQVFGQEDMQWSFGVTDRGESRDDIIAQHVQLINLGLESVDEGRIDLGRAPWGLPETSVPLWGTQSGPIPLSTLTSETGEMINPAPGQADNLGAKPMDDELVTPAHGVNPRPEQGPKNQPQAQVGDPSKCPVRLPPTEQKARMQTAAEAEFSQFARYIKNGKDPHKFLAKALTGDVIHAAGSAMAYGSDAAIDAARAALVDMLDAD